jgi:membrane protease YdiL (CAAX protease family)
MEPMPEATVSVRVAVLCLIGAVLAMALPLACPNIRTPYFLGAGMFGGLAVACFGLALGARQAQRPAASTTFWIFGATFLAYAAMELVYQRMTLRLPLTGTSPAAVAFLGQVNGYVLDRSYQYFAILALWLLLRLALAPTWTSRVQPGDPRQETTILGGDQPMPWSRVARRLTAMIILLAGAGAFLRFTGTFDGRLAALLGGRFLGGFNNSLIEEIVFRGLLLPAFLLPLGPTGANWLQAAFFSVNHYSFIEEWALLPVAIESCRLLFYLGIGWFLGRSTLETGGIGISTYLHFLITAAIWTTLTLGGS